MHTYTHLRFDISFRSEIQHSFGELSFPNRRVKVVLLFVRHICIVIWTLSQFYSYLESSCLNFHSENPFVYSFVVLFSLKPNVTKCYSETFNEKLMKFLAQS